MILDQETIADWRIPAVPTKYVGKVEFIFVSRSFTSARVEIYVFVPAKPKPVKSNMKWGDVYLAHDPDWEELYVRWLVDGMVLTHEEYVNSR